jgi:predicted nucleic acid-binding protein
VIIADTSGLLALFNAREPRHDDVRKAVERDRDPMVVSPYVMAEVDSLVATRLGVDAELRVLAELAGGAYHLASRHPAKSILTLDRRHFSVLRPLDGGRFRLLP